MAMFRIRATSFVAGFAAASAIALYQLHTGVWSSHQDLGNKVIFLNSGPRNPILSHFNLITSSDHMSVEISYSDPGVLLGNSVLSMSIRLGLAFPYLIRLSSTHRGVLSYLSWFSCVIIEVLLCILYKNLLESSHFLWRCNRNSSRQGSIVRN